MPVIYGEGSRAFIQLQQELMKVTIDDSILAWGFNLVKSVSTGSSIISVGILATALSDFANCGRIVLTKQDTTPVNTFDISGSRL
jgi:hypothetical protein